MVFAATAVGISTAASVGSASVTFAALGSSAAFPLASDAGHHYLVGTDGIPFPVFGRTAWFLPSISSTDRATFLDDTVSKGYTAVEFHAIDHDPRGNNAPFNGAGNLPFTTKIGGGSYTSTSDSPDMETTNSSYWTFIDQILSDCEARGLLVLMFGAYTGFPNATQSTAQGWMNEMVTNNASGAGGHSKIFNYGAFIANRYINTKNIIHMLGGDHGVFTGSESTAEDNYILGIKSVTKASELYSAEWTSPAPSGSETFGGEVNIQGAYSWEGKTDDYGRRSYGGGIPAILLEEPYDQEGPDGNGFNNTNATQPVRRFVYWGLFSTIAGFVAGNGFVWPFTTGWQSHLNTTGAQDLARLMAFWRSFKWHQLVPDGKGSIGTLVTAGGGTLGSGNAGAQGSFVAAAANPDGTILVAYVPPGHSGSVTIDMSKIASQVRARWFDPTNASYSGIGSFSASGTHAFTTPGTNSAGENDFVLVLTAENSVGSSSVVFAATATGKSTANVAGTSTVTFAATATGISTALTAGTATATFSAAALASSVALSTGSSSVAFGATAVGASVGAGAGTASVTFAATAVGQASSAAAGTSSVTFAASAVGTAAVLSVGTSSVTFAAAATSGGAAVGSSTVTFAATAVGKSTAATPGTSAVTFSAAGVGASTALTAGTSSVTFTAAATTGNALAGAGTSSVTFTATGFGFGTGNGAGLASALFTANAVGHSIAQAAGTAGVVFAASAFLFPIPTARIDLPGGGLTSASSDDPRFSGRTR